MKKAYWLVFAFIGVFVALAVQAKHTSNLRQISILGQKHNCTRTDSYQYRCINANNQNISNLSIHLNDFSYGPYSKEDTQELLAGTMHTLLEDFVGADTFTFTCRDSANSVGGLVFDDPTEEVFIVVTPSGIFSLFHYDHGWATRENLNELCQFNP